MGIKINSVPPTPKNGLILTPLENGFTISGGIINSKIMTVPDDTTISGNNTGDQDLSSLSSKSLSIAYAIALG